MHCCCISNRNGFENERIEALLNSIELGIRHQSSKFGLNLGVVSLYFDVNDIEFLTIKAV